MKTSRWEGMDRRVRMNRLPEHDQKLVVAGEIPRWIHWLSFVSRHRVKVKYAMLSLVMACAGAEWRGLTHLVSSCIEPVMPSMAMWSMIALWVFAGYYATSIFVADLLGDGRDVSLLDTITRLFLFVLVLYGFMVLFLVFIIALMCYGTEPEPRINLNYFFHPFWSWPWAKCIEKEA
ncbi:MAG: hypothetical protein KGI50_03520 [Patescibacteria group bacterium]|nr:hypothetical protein [Patescibacteria group bacterium]MDE2438360.1 hypothetical protein [Patescibacteria group bacterium]